MRYCYKLDYKDFKQAQSAYWKTSLRRRIRFHVLHWGLLFCGCLLAVIVWPLAFESTLRLIAMPIAVGCMAGGAVAILMRPLQIIRCYRANGGDRRLPKDIYLEVSGDLLISGNEGKSEGRFLRAAVCDVGENGRFLFLFISKKRFLYLPKYRLPEQAMDEVRTWLLLPGAPDKC